MLELDHIYNRDCIDGMQEIDDNSVDTIITDPPYGLSFMGKKWDYNVPSIDIWKECLRVLKPGGTLLCFAGSRTQHRMACNVEDAGFILKDCIMWIYGSGFPKATDISKQLDKGHKRKVVGKKQHAKRDFKDNLYAQAPANANNTKVFGYGEELITEPSSPESELWNGWKSHGLKPAYEPILVAMKANDESYAQNALKHGVSGLNIDGGRIPLNGEENPTGSAKRIYVKNQYDADAGYGKNKTTPDKGRYPANIILDEESAKMLDEQSGITTSSGGSGQASMKTAPNDIYGNYQEGHKSTNLGGLGDKGGASRFFYCAKASKSERNAGLNNSFEKEIGHNRFDKCAICGGYILQNPDRPSACKCEKPEREHNIIKGNYHPTVKPLKLMEYLCILTKTPTGGIVLDPFIGSGTTALACRKTGRHFIGFEISKEYCDISNKRLANIPKRLDNWF